MHIGLAWLYCFAEFPDGHLDHINHDRSDNRLDNLREVTYLENQRNRTRSKNNTSGTTGVYWSADRNRWRVSISINNKTKHLGSHINKEDAVAAREAANIKYGFHENHGKI